jgi:hypothetical protein
MVPASRAQAQAGGNALLSGSSYNRVVKSIALAVAVGLLLMAGCGRSVENPEAVRTAILDYLATQKKLNVANMQVDITALTFRQNEADATVSVGLKGTPGGAGMTWNYTLEKKGNAWVVKGRTESGGTPHGAGAMPGAAPGAMPSGHPDVGAKQPAEPKK